VALVSSPSLVTLLYMSVRIEARLFSNAPVDHAPDVLGLAADIC